MLEGRIDERMALRFSAVDERFGALDERFSALDERFAAVGHQIEAAKHEVMAAFRGEIVSAVTGQTRTTIVALIGSMLASGSLVLAATRLG
jgi:hypothetical protein